MFVEDHMTSNPHTARASAPLSHACELMEQRRGQWSYFLAGSPSELDPILARFVEEGILTDIVFSVISA